MDTDRRARRSPTMQQLARRADYKGHSDSEHSARSDCSGDPQSHTPNT